MARNVLKTAVLLLVAAMLVSCGSSANIMQVLRGNFAYSRGDYQGALVSYMVSMENDPEDAWIRFNIGNVYYALGEHEAALEVWHVARQAGEMAAESGASDLALMFATSYNRGVLYYQQGRFQEAYDEFTYALTANSRNVDAKANLELALEKIQATEATEGTGEGTAPGDAPTPGAADEDAEQTLRLLEYVRRKETQQWFANRDIQEEDDSRDW